MASRDSDSIGKCSNDYSVRRTRDRGSLWTSQNKHSLQFNRNRDGTRSSINRDNDTDTQHLCRHSRRIRDRLICVRSRFRPDMGLLTRDQLRSPKTTTLRGVDRFAHGRVHMPSSALQARQSPRAGRWYRGREVPAQRRVLRPRPVPIRPRLRNLHQDRPCRGRGCTLPSAAATVQRDRRPR